MKRMSSMTPEQLEQELARAYRALRGFYHYAEGRRPSGPASWERAR